MCYLTWSWEKPKENSEQHSETEIHNFTDSDCQIINGIRVKNLQATLLFADFSKALNSIHRGKMEQILPAYGLPKETIAIIMFYKNKKAMFCSSIDDTEFFDIVAQVLQEDTFASHLFIICLD